MGGNGRKEKQRSWQSSEFESIVCHQLSVTCDKLLHLSGPQFLHQEKEGIELDDSERSSGSRVGGCPRPQQAGPSSMR